jgi:hypothetical protein
VRRNYPYKGIADGHVTALRRTFGPRYSGIELEVCNDRVHDLHEIMETTLLDTIRVFK